MAWEASVEPARVAPTRESLSHYLYAVVDGLPRRWRPPSSGIGPGPVLARRVRDLTIISSAVDAPPSRTPRAVALHNEVVASTFEADAVLPIEFGTVIPAPGVEAWLAANLGVVRARLARCRRHVEMRIRLVSLATSDGTRDRLRETADSLVDHAGLPDWQYRDDGVLASSLAFTVPRDGVEGFLARIAPVAARAGTVAVVPTGPWPVSSLSTRGAPELAPAPASALARAG